MGWVCVGDVARFQRFRISTIVFLASTGIRYSELVPVQVQVA